MRISMVFAGLVAFSAVACGGSSEDGGKGGNGSTTVNTSIPDETKGSELTQAQADELCDAAAAVAKATFSEAQLKPAMCGLAAWTQASAFNKPDMCQDFYDECLKAPQDNDPPVEQEGQCTKPSSACTATVGEIEKCISDSFAQSKAMLAKFPGCDDVGKEFSEDDLGSDESPASCKIVEEKCPEAIETTASPELPGVVGDGAQDNAPPASP